MARKSWWFHFLKSIEIYKNSGDKFIGHEANGNRYYERMLGDKLKRYVLNDADLDIPGKTTAEHPERFSEDVVFGRF